VHRLADIVGAGPVRRPERAIFTGQPRRNQLLHVHCVTRDAHDDFVEPAEIIGNDVFWWVADEFDPHGIGHEVRDHPPEAVTPSIDERERQRILGWQRAQGEIVGDLAVLVTGPH
jgi:hypothetical protein